VGGAVVEALRRRDLPVRALVRRDDERADASRATGAEVVVAPRPALTGTRLDPFARTAEDRSLAWERAGQRQCDGLKREDGRCTAKFARRPWLARVGLIDEWH
jgi:hypothetical protein